MSKEIGMSAADALSGRHVTIIGAGVIGSSWATLFLVNGMIVTVSDPQPGIDEHVRAHIRSQAHSLKDLGYDVSVLTSPDFEGRLIFDADLAKAVARADYVQENGPERLEIKRDLWKVIEAHAPKTALLLSSSSGINAGPQSADMQQPGRLMIGHPFNPPHLMQLVEIATQAETPEELEKSAFAFYRALGKVPVKIQKEVPGFVVNRLQCALFRECVHLVSDGVISVGDLDRAVMASIGTRWAAEGPFLAFHLGGGEGGFAHFIEHLGPDMEKNWAAQQAEKVAFDEKTKKLLLEQVQQAYGQNSIASLEAVRDNRETIIINQVEKEIGASAL